MEIIELFSSKNGFLMTSLAVDAPRQVDDAPRQVGDAPRQSHALAIFEPLRFYELYEPRGVRKRTVLQF